MRASLWRWVPLLGICAVASTPLAAAPRYRSQPIIDMHLHAGELNLAAPVAICPGNQPLTYPAVDPRDLEAAPGPVCGHPIFSPTTSAALKNSTIAELRRLNVRRAVLAGSLRVVKEWSRAAPGQFIPATVPSERSIEALATLRRIHRDGNAKVFAEVNSQYLGIRADDPSLEPFWALAEELDVPVGIHLGEGMPGQSYTGRPDRYRTSLTSPFQLEGVLIRHRRLRVYVMHAASPLTDEMIAMLFEYPTLYVDIAANNWNMPRAQFYDQFKRLVDAGFSKRVLFGSDQTIWPQGIGLAIATVNGAPFLTAEQKRDIFYNNAARFLRLSKEEIARDHAPPGRSR